MGRKKNYQSYDDLLHDINNEPLIEDEEDTLDLLEDDDLALLQAPQLPTPPKKPRKKKSPVKKPRKG